MDKRKLYLRVIRSTAFRFLLSVCFLLIEMFDAIWRKVVNMKNYLWFKVMIGGNEFDKSLDLDLDKMVKMNENQEKKYQTGIVKKRQIAHELDMKEDQKREG